MRVLTLTGFVYHKSCNRFQENASNSVQRLDFDLFDHQLFCISREKVCLLCAFFQNTKVSFQNQSDISCYCFLIHSVWQKLESLNFSSLSRFAAAVAKIEKIELNFFELTECL